MSTDLTTFEVGLSRMDRFAFEMDLTGDGAPDLVTDEPPPLGEGRGPNPTRLLAGAVGNCMAASLLFCLQKARIDVAGLRARVTGAVERNPDGRLRVAALDVTLEPEIGAEVPRERIERCLQIFENYCVVTQSVRAGIEVRAAVEPRVVATEPTPLPG